MLKSCIYSLVVDLISGGCKRKIGVLAAVWADGPGVSDGDANCTGADGVAAGWSLIKEIGIRT